MEERGVPLHEHLLIWLEKDITPFLHKNGFIDPSGNFKTVSFKEQFDGAIRTKCMPTELDSLISIAPSIATAYEYLDNMKLAMHYFWVGTYNWVHEWSTSPTDNLPKNIHVRSSYATRQLDAAICNDRIGNHGRAKQLFEWAVCHLTVTDDEKDQFLKEGSYNMVWEYTTDRAFCLLCLERWEGALAAAEEAERWMRMDAERKEKFGAQYTPFHLLPVYLALARYKAHPSLEREKEARKRMMLSEFRVRVNHLRHGALIYIFELCSRNPDLLR